MKKLLLISLMTAIFIGFMPALETGGYGGAAQEFVLWPALSGNGVGIRAVNTDSDGVSLVAERSAVINEYLANAGQKRHRYSAYVLPVKPAGASDRFTKEASTLRGA